MPDKSPATEIDALGELMVIQSAMQRQFLRIMLRRMASDLPAFDAEMFLAELELMRESLAEGRDRSAIHGFASAEWQRLSEMALEAIASTRAKPETH